MTASRANRRDRVVGRAGRVDVLAVRAHDDADRAVEPLDLVDAVALALDEREPLRSRVACEDGDGVVERARHVDVRSVRADGDTLGEVESVHPIRPSRCTSTKVSTAPAAGIARPSQIASAIDATLEHPMNRHGTVPAHFHTLAPNETRTDLRAADRWSGRGRSDRCHTTVDSALDDPDADLGATACASLAGTCTLRAALQQSSHRAGFDVMLLIGPCQERSSNDPHALGCRQWR